MNHDLSRAGIATATVAAVFLEVFKVCHQSVSSKSMIDLPSGWWIRIGVREIEADVITIALYRMKKTQ